MVNSTKPETEITTAEQIRSRAQQLIDDAKSASIVVRIDLVPLQPLAMGNLEMVVDVRSARNRA